MFRPLPPGRPSSSCRTASQEKVVYVRSYSRRLGRTRPVPGDFLTGCQSTGFPFPDRFVGHYPSSITSQPRALTAMGQSNSHAGIVASNGSTAALRYLSLAVMKPDTCPRIRRFLLRAPDGFWPVCREIRRCMSPQRKAQAPTGGDLRRRGRAHEFRCLASSLLSSVVRCVVDRVTDRVRWQEAESLGRIGGGDGPQPVAHSEARPAVRTATGEHSHTLKGRKL